MNDNNRCVFCNRNSWQKRKGNNIIMYPNYINKGLKFYLCNRFACNLCLKIIIDAMNDNEKLITDPWFYEVREYLQNEYYIPFQFVGHCCEIKQKVKE